MILLLVEFAVLYGMFILYSCFEGEREAYFFISASVSGLSDKVNLHPLFVKQRLIVVLIAVCCLPWLLGVVLFFAFLFTFSFFHNGCYHKKINDINPKVYPLRWRASTGNAIEMSKLGLLKRIAVISYMLFNERKQIAAAFDFTYKNRLVQFIVGAALFIAGLGIILNNY